MTYDNTSIDTAGPAQLPTPAMTAEDFDALVARAPDVRWIIADEIRLIEQIDVKLTAERIADFMVAALDRAGGSR